MSRFTCRPRLIWFVGSFICLGTLGYMDVSALIAQIHGKSFFAEGRRPLDGLDWFFSLFILALVLYVLWYYFWKLTLVSFDVSKRQLIVRLPFQLQKHRYEFDKVNGFYFTSQWGKWCEIKQLVLLLSTNKKIKISDLETGNFREMEAGSWELFPFLDQKTQTPLTEEQKQAYRTTTNKTFDYRQAKSIRFSLIVSLVVLILLACMDFSISSNGSLRSLPKPVQVGILLLIPYVVYELSKIARRIQQLRE